MKMVRRCFFGTSKIKNSNLAFIFYFDGFIQYSYNANANWKLSCIHNGLPPNFFSLNWSSYRFKSWVKL